MSELLYDKMVEAAAERAADTGAVDMVDIANAVSNGFDALCFVADVAKLADVIDYVR